MKELPKPNRMPDHMDDLSAYWFDEMVCVTAVSFPMATSTRVCPLFEGEYAVGRLFIKMPEGANDPHRCVSQFTQTLYEYWKRHRAEQLLIDGE